MAFFYSIPEKQAFVQARLSMYNGQRGNVRHKNLNRWFFYIYYPVHMVLLFVIQASVKMISQSCIAARF